MTYAQKQQIADNHLFELCGMGWNDLPDINSLHDCETKQDIIEACADRLGEIMPLDMLYD